MPEEYDENAVECIDCGSQWEPGEFSPDDAYECPFCGSDLVV